MSDRHCAIFFVSINSVTTKRMNLLNDLRNESVKRKGQNSTKYRPNVCACMSG